MTDETYYWLLVVIALAGFSFLDFGGVRLIKWVIFKVKRFLLRRKKLDLDDKVFIGALAVSTLATDTYAVFMSGLF